MQISLLQRFQGCLLGLAVGDALGRPFEGADPYDVQDRFPTPAALINWRRLKALRYTDDTQMMIGVAETLADAGEIDERRLCAAFAANYVPERGYGCGARAVLETMEEGGDHRAVAETYFPGGSYGNGAAMRVAPVGLLFRDDLEEVREQARLSALPTHVHPLGVEGAQLLALAVALASREGPFDRERFFAELMEYAESPEFLGKLRTARHVTEFEDLEQLGTGMEATEAVVTAIACFALTPDSYDDVVGHAVQLGGDTDTIAAMAGALAGARLGVRALPERLVAILEDGYQGRSYITALAGRLHDTYETLQNEPDTPAIVWARESR